MKKLLLLGAFLLTVFAVQSAYSYSGRDCCPTNCPPDQSTGDCYCQFVQYQPCYYTTKRCIEEQIPCPRRCCRYVPQYYEVQKCRYVPQYYTETRCRQVPEYYCVEEYRTCKKVICEPQCRYVPRYYWKRVCNAPSGPACAPACP